MKTIFFLLLSAALLPQEVKCQPIVISAKANLIVVNNFKADSFKFVVQTLMMDGYNIDLSDSSTGIVNCHKSIMDGRISLNILVADSIMENSEHIDPLKSE